MRYSDVAGPDEPDFAGPGIAMLFPIASADVGGDGASWLTIDDTRKASVEDEISARKAMAVMVAFGNIMDRSGCPVARRGAYMYFPGRECRWPFEGR